MAYGTTNKYIVYSVNAQEVQVDSSNNRSLVRVWVDIWRTNTGYTTYGSGTVTVNCDGQTRSASITSSQKITSSAIRLCTFDFWVNHNSNGSKSAWVSAIINHSQFSSNWNGWTFNLSNIPRKATITSCSSFNDEANPSFSFSNPGNFDMETWLEPNPNGTHYFARKVSGTSGTFTFELTEEEKETLRKQCKGKSCTIRVGLYSNGKSWNDYKDVTYTIINCEPEINSIAFEDTNADVLAFTENNQVIVQGVSTLRVHQPNAVFKKNATLKRWKIVGNGFDDWIDNNQTYVDLGTVNNDSDIEITVTVEDSRSIAVSKTFTIEVTSYNLPTISATAERLNNFENETTLHAVGNISSVNEKNTMSITYRYRKISDEKESYSNWIDIENDTDVVANFEKEHAYEIEFRIKDKIVQVTYTLVLEKGIPMIVFDVSRLSMGVNKFPSRNGTLETDNLDYKGYELLDFIFPIGAQIYNSNKNFNPNNLYVGTKWERIKGVVLAGINEDDEDTDEHTSFSQEAGTVIGNKYLQKHTHVVPIKSASDERTGYGLTQSQAFIDRIAVTGNGISSGEFGAGNAQNIQPTKLTYIWERIE